jgi:archaellum component FlaC
MSGSDDLGSLEDLDDGDDLGGLGDEGEFGDLGDDEFGGMDDGDEMAGGGGGNLDELEHRLDELENEVGSLSSTVNTVRNENEQISESVQDVEENVRKLLDIYEMVTRGVNPFADEMDAGMGMGGMDAEDSSFGLFTDDEQPEEESVDEDITDADAEGFFDDDLVDGEEEAEEGIDADIGDVFDEEDDSAEDTDADTGEFDDVGDETGEFGDIDDEGFDEIGGDEFDGASDEETGDAGTSGGDGPLGDGLDEDPSEGAVAAEETPQAESFASEPETAGETQAEGGQSSDGAAGSEPSETSAGKPYLDALPTGITGDLIVVEWLEYLVDELGVRGASEAIDYYETIDWITGEVAAGLDEHLGEFGSGGRGSLAVEHHKQSLAYIDQLNGGDAETQRASGFDRGGPPS